MNSTIQHFNLPIDIWEIKKYKLLIIRNTPGRFPFEG